MCEQQGSRRSFSRDRSIGGYHFFLALLLPSWPDAEGSSFWHSPSTLLSSVCPALAFPYRQRPPNLFVLAGVPEKWPLPCYTQRATSAGIGVCQKWLPYCHPQEIPSRGQCPWKQLLSCGGESYPHAWIHQLLPEENLSASWTTSKHWPPACLQQWESRGNWWVHRAHTRDTPVAPGSGDQGNMCY